MENVKESILSKDWWLSLLSEEDVMDKKIKYKDKEGDDKEATVGGILKKGEEHPAHKKAVAITKSFAASRAGKSALNRGKGGYSG